LLTGAAGRIGTAFFDQERDRYRFRLADREQSDLSSRDTGEHEVVTLDVADLDAVQRACAGGPSGAIDTVVHLAADPSPAADFYGSLLENNIKGTYNVFQAARDQGCARVVFAK
ncbi:MAG: NAD-dependent epimerase/dehydratase family protein, partial [Thermomicrobiales bacterium]